MESCPWDYQTILSRYGENIKASFCRVPPPEVQEEVFMHNVMSTENSDMVRDSGKSGEKPRNLDLVLILAVQILILLRNWIDFLSH